MSIKIVKMTPYRNVGAGKGGEVVKFLTLLSHPPPLLIWDKFDIGDLNVILLKHLTVKVKVKGKR